MVKSRLASIYLFLCCFLLSTAATDATASASRTLYWRALDVSAHLNYDGRLHVRERHTMVFNGDWNGGERRFRLGHGQRLEFIRLVRIDPVTGLETPLREGSLAYLNNYQWIDHETLRWRSRLPSEPPFRGTELVYEIEYRLANILLVRDGEYVLDHDFAFPERPGPIQRFSLEFDWSPVWQASPGFNAALTRQDLQPGQSVVVAVPFKYVGSSVPAGIIFPVAPLWRYLLLAALIVFVGWRGLLWFRHELRLGCFEPLVPVEKIDESWLQEHIFKFAPEVVGATWDKRTAAPEVAAVLARMTAEGKLASEVRPTGAWWWRRNVLHLELICDREQLGDYELALVNALFFKGNTTATDSIRKHYRRSGFDPAKKIQSALERRIKSMAKIGERPLPPSARLTVALAAGAVLLLGIDLWPQVLQVLHNEIQAPTVMNLAVLIVGTWTIMRGVCALYYDSYIVHVAWGSANMLAGTFALLVALGYVLVSNAFGLSLWLLGGLTALVAAACNSQFNGMHSRDSREFNLFRKRLASGRRYLQRELQRSTPQLKDAWYPYLLAFGLGPNIDRWFRSYGMAGAPGRSFGHIGDGSTSTSSGWTGGGGSFGGAGASGSWAAAVGKLASGVMAASSRSGSSGGGGGGGSSGGGGGGGW